MRKLAFVFVLLYLLTQTPFANAQAGDPNLMWFQRIFVNDEVVVTIYNQDGVVVSAKGYLTEVDANSSHFLVSNTEYISVGRLGEKARTVVQGEHWCAKFIGENKVIYVNQGVKILDLVSGETQTYYEEIDFTPNVSKSGCPIPSPDGTRFLVQTTNSLIEINIETGQTRVIADHYTSLVAYSPQNQIVYSDERGTRAYLDGVHLTSASTIREFEWVGENQIVFATGNWPGPANLFVLTLGQGSETLGSFERFAGMGVGPNGIAISQYQGGTSMSQIMLLVDGKITPVAAGEHLVSPFWVR